MGGYGTSTPNYWKIKTFGGGDMAKRAAGIIYDAHGPPQQGAEGRDFRFLFVFQTGPTESGPARRSMRELTAQVGSSDVCDR